MTSKEAGSKRKGEKCYYVYVLLCDDGSYYTGYTNNVSSRLERHRKGRGARCTRMRKPEKVVYAEESRASSAAVRREQQIKALSHVEKRRLTSIRLS